VFFPANVAIAAENRAAVAEAVSRFGGLDVACLNAGIGGGTGLGANFDPDAYRRALGVNLDGMVYGANAAVSAMRAHGRGGAIVFTASIAGLAPAADLYYATAKHALIGLMRSMAMLLAKDRISVNAICPGFVDTAIIAPVRERLLDAGLALLQPADVAAVVAEIVAGGETGQAWEIQAGRPAQPVAFRPITLSRT
jgi:NAD(P)-dependent dehydrogenase (short-subunit alcohol dehydrogenase family)